MENQNMENQNMENQTTPQEGQQQNAQEPQRQEKTFTQEDVNRIVQERLARAKIGADNSGYTEREQALERRERSLEAREKLADAGIPKELLPLVNCNSKKEMEDSIKLIGTYFHNGKNTGSTYRVVSTGATSGGAGSSSLSEVSDSDIRAAMGLKGRQ